ncbi:MAG: beta-ketoacyl synthase N-terminal-like domain-containing protein, partial [Cyanobacteriota bacterium]|nr:beta-ketoacyl synthase N-terminal-like domain-containing protein [Cyanobacteriota bacterium]
WMSPVAFLQQPYRWLRAISRYGGTVSGAPNFAYQLCCDRISEEQKQTLNLGRWRIAFTGAEPIRAQTLKQFSQAFQSCGFSDRAFYPCYGLAESTLMVAGKRDCWPVRQFQGEALRQNRALPRDRGNDAQPLVSCGKPDRDCTVAVVNVQTQHPCQEGEIGEIWLSSPSVARGYWQRPLETRATFQASLQGNGPFLRTGDLGFLCEGELYLAGRLKDLIILRGRNYYPQDIELTVEQAHPALKANCGAAFAIDLTDSEGLVVVQEVKRVARKEPLEPVIAAIRDRLSRQCDLQATAIVLIEPNGIPKTSSGKIQRQACRQLFLEGKLDPHILNEQRTNSSALPNPPLAIDSDRSRLPLVPPKTSGNQQRASDEIATWLSEKLAQTLHVDSQAIDPHQPLASYGLDSATAVGLSGELETWLQRKIEPTLVYNYPTIAEIADYLAQKTPPPRPKRRPTPKSEDLAIIGMGCRFPGAPNPAAFWQLLATGQEAVGPSPRCHRLGLTSGGFLASVDEFDAQFFAIAPREARAIDPQHRLLLEVAWEALENAGIAPSQLAGSKTGVFVGISSGDYARLRSPASAYTGLGNAHSIAANRLSYHLDLRGPSLAVDTACSSSLVAIHLASQSLGQNECDLAIVGGVNLILDSHLNQALTRAQMLAADGRCKTFAAEADGYGRGEGCGVAILKSLKAAMAAGDRILGIIKGSAVEQDGRSNGLTAPNGRSQQTAIEQAWAKAGIPPQHASYIEAHGTGTPLGDPIEMAALQAVLAGDERSFPCAVGSVKTNIGHLEAAAGMAGLIKVVLSLQQQAIPAHLNLNKLNPYLAMDDKWVCIPAQLQPWQTPASPRYAGVSSFGFGGTNAHVVVAEAPPRRVARQDGARSHHLLTLSAKHPDALKTLARNYAREFEERPELSIADACFTANTGRSHFHYRWAAVAGDLADLKEQLQGFAATETVPVARSAAPKLAFLCTGQGAQSINAGRQLYETQPVFRRVLEQCDRVLRPDLDLSLLALLYPDDSEAEKMAALLDRTRYAQPALFSLECAIAALWQSWGIVPDILLGHSLGEYIAAYLAGAFSLRDGLRLAAARGRLMETLPPGEMYAVFASEMAVREAIAKSAQPCEIAAINAPESMTISGTAAAIAPVLEILHERGVESKKLRVSAAFHSAATESILTEFAEILAKVSFSPLQRPLVANLTGAICAVGETIEARYWCRHLRETVQFSAGMAALEAWGVDAFVEIGPQPTLLGFAQSVGSRGTVARLPSLRRNRETLPVIFKSLARLYQAGARVDWSGFHRPDGGERIELPAYPFVRSRYWLEAPRSSLKLIRDRLLERVEELSQDRSLTDYLAFLHTLDAPAVGYILQACRQLGCPWQEADVFEGETLARALGIAPQHYRFWHHLLDILQRAGGLEKVEDKWRVCQDLDSLNFPSLPSRSRHPEAEVELTLLERCGTNLAAILQKKCDPLTLLFPEGDLSLLTRLYQESPGAKAMNQLLQEAVILARQNSETERPFKILEIGAGTGGTTAGLLAKLSPENLDYTFTDISPLFLANAREKFRNFSNMSYAKLNIEDAPGEQGLTETYDLVIAANVLHATQDLKRSLTHIQQLLLPQGLLLLLEGTTAISGFDLIFGTTEGWWRFTDTNLRPHHPLISGARWQQILEETGFEQTVTVAPQLDRYLSPQTLIIAEKTNGDRALFSSNLSKGKKTPTNAKSFPTEARAKFDSTLIERWKSARDRSLVLKQYLCTEITQKLGLPSLKTLDSQQNLLDLGLDSLMALELKNSLEQTLAVELPATLALEYPTLNALIDRLDQKLIEKYLTSESSQSQPIHPQPSTTNLDNLSEAQVTDLLHQLLKQPQP